MRNWVMGLAVALFATGAMAAEPVDGKSARKMLFSHRGVELVVLPDSGLDATQLAIVEALLKGLKDEGLANYYGAVALSPSFFELMANDPGQAALSGLLQVSEKLHNPTAAANAAMKACKKARKSRHPACVLAARVLPRKWEARDVMLSVTATQAFKAYRKGAGPKAMAISIGSVDYAIAKGDDATKAALAACNKSAINSGSPDCEIVIAD